LNNKKREESMQLRWTVHIPQAMQQHGGGAKLRPEVTLEKVEARPTLEAIEPVRQMSAEAAIRSQDQQSG
jgi:hypothetical protein